MPSKGKNISIAQPRSRPPRPNLLKSTKATFQYPNSVINSYYQPNLFGTPSSSNRKLQIYDVEHFSNNYYIWETIVILY